MLMNVRPARVRFDNSTKENKHTMNKKTVTNMSTGKRYSIVNKNTGSVRRGANTRAEARSVKKVNERIYDTAKAAFIR